MANLEVLSEPEGLKCIADAVYTQFSVTTCPLGSLSPGPYLAK